MDYKSKTQKKKEADSLQELGEKLLKLSKEQIEDIELPSEIYDAIKFAKKACELTKYKQPEVLDTLAAAYASAGRFSEAVTTAEKALQLAQASQQDKLIVGIQKHLKLYKAEQPYIEPPPGALH